MKRLRDCGKSVTVYLITQHAVIADRPVDWPCYHEIEKRKTTHNRGWRLKGASCNQNEEKSPLIRPQCNDEAAVVPMHHQWQLIGFVGKLDH